MIKLDFNRDHGITSPGYKGPGAPEDELPAIYNQDGLYFNAHGDVVESTLTKADRARIEKMLAEKAALAAAADAYRESLIAGGASPDAAQAAAEGLAAAAVKGAVETPPAYEYADVVAWAKGQQKYPWAKIQKTMRDKHSRTVSGKDDAITFLVEAGMLAADEVRV